MAFHCVDLAGLSRTWEVFKNSAHGNASSMQEAFQRLVWLNEQTYVQDSELKAVMAAADADGNGLIDYDEFIALHCQSEQAGA